MKPRSVTTAIVILAIVSAACTQVPPQPDSGSSPAGGYLVPLVVESLSVGGTEPPVPTPTHSMEPDLPAYARRYRLVNTCDEWTCLFAAEDTEPPYLIGYASLRGYYSKVEREEAEDEAEDCDGFVIVDAPAELLSAYEAAYAGEASVLSRTADSKPIINVDLSNQDDLTKSVITASRPEAPIEIRVLNERPPFFSGAVACLSPVSILGAIEPTDYADLTQDYEITESDNGMTFTYTLTTRFTVNLDDAVHPLSGLVCDPDPIYGYVSNGSSGDPSRYPVQYEITRTGRCQMRNGDFEVSIVAEPLR